MPEYDKMNDGDLLIHALWAGIDLSQIKMHREFPEVEPKSVLDFVRNQLTHQPGYGCTVMGRNNGYLSHLVRKTLIQSLSMQWIMQD
jgi:hypothetical protein